MAAVAFSFEIAPTDPLEAKAIAFSDRRNAPLSADTYDLITDRAGFDALEADWSQLFDRAGRGEQMFLQFNWLWHWANHYVASDQRFAIITARRNGRLILVWPMVVEPVAGLTQLSFMGAPVSQYGDVLIDRIADTERVLDDAWAHLRSKQRFDVVRLAKVRADAAIAPKLAALGFTITAEEEAPYANLSGRTFDDLEQRASVKHRKNRRRQLRRLEERGPLAINVHAGTPPARDAIRTAMTLKRAWLNDKALVSNAFKDQRIDAFFADAAASTTRPCGVSISMLTTNGEAGDANVSVSCKGRRAVHILAYSLKFDKYGVGNYHLEADLKRSLGEGMSTYDFLAPRHAYKMDWADGTVLVRDHSLAISPKGRLYVDVYIAWLREGLKRSIGRLPAPLRRIIAGTHNSVA